MLRGKTYDASPSTCCLPAAFYSDIFFCFYLIIIIMEQSDCLTMVNVFQCRFCETHRRMIIWWKFTLLFMMNELLYSFLLLQSLQQMYCIVNIGMYEQKDKYACIFIELFKTFFWSNVFTFFNLHSCQGHKNFTMHKNTKQKLKIIVENLLNNFTFFLHSYIHNNYSLFYNKWIFLYSSKKVFPFNLFQNENKYLFIPLAH